MREEFLARNSKKSSSKDEKSIQVMDKLINLKVQA